MIEESAHSFPTVGTSMGLAFKRGCTSVEDEPKSSTPEIIEKVVLPLYIQVLLIVELLIP